MKSLHLITVTARSLLHWTQWKLVWCLPHYAKPLSWKNGEKIKLPNRSTYVDRQRFDKPQEVNSVAIGKDNEGVIWMAVLQEAVHNSAFTLSPTNGGTTSTVMALSLIALHCLPLWFAVTSKSLPAS